jgi:peptidyl-prolyl cis-trans isomerase B (cyclophilin B)
MVNTGANTNGSQFYIITGDTSPLSNAYTVIGDVTTGMDIIDKVVKAGAVDDSGKAAAQGKPKTALTFQSLTVGPAATPGASATPTLSPTTAPPTSS